MFASTLSWCFIVAFAAHWSPIDARRCIRTNRELPPSCESKIYCQGELLHTVQMAQIFNDSKTFVDMQIKGTVSQTLIDFDDLMASTNHSPSKQQIKTFVESHFDSENELEHWTPDDFHSHPEFLDEITNEEVRNFAQELVNIWPRLGRKTRKEVAEEPDRFSLISVPNGFIIPGGRFREYYYWDSYWIINGLLISGMDQTAKGMIDNFVSIIKTYGFIPNGGRVYYTQRSQPPLLANMFWQYVNVTGDLTWLRENIEYLDEELQFWVQKRSMTVSDGSSEHQLATYVADSKGPRPESYIEDFLTAAYFTDPSQQQEVYNDLKAAAQSGWDFSSRWIIDENGGTNANISYIATRRVIPVDLNAFLCSAFKHASDLYNLLDMADRSAYWLEKSEQWMTAIEKILWNEDDNIWYDYDIQLSQHRKYFSASNLAPLWNNAYNTDNKQSIGDKIVQYLEKNYIQEYLGGIPTTLLNSGEQWDFPNAWPPLQAIVVEGLDSLEHPEASQYAETFARNWVEANMIGFNNSGEMFEKYDAVTPGAYGGGGEYNVQLGFGWTNGVALQFIKKYYT